MSNENRRWHRIRKNFCAAVIFGCLLIFLSTAFAQELPKEIRGYKVHRADISVTNQTARGDAPSQSEAFVKVGEPMVTSVSFAGVTFELPAEFETARQSGTVDFLAFQDFRVNGLPVEVAEYQKSFTFKKNQSVVLPKPITITVAAGNALRGALGEVRESKDEWTVTGKVFVFGRFKKSLLKFKRVIPININLQIKNPVK